MDLKGKVFIKGTNQAACYDDAYKALMTYFGSKYDQRVYRAFEQKDATAGSKMLKKPVAPMVDKVIQEATLGSDSKLVGKLVKVLDKDGEDFVTYQIQLKQYIGDLAKYTDNLEKCFSVILGQCSPAMEQSLESDTKYKTVKQESDSIELIKMLERICYNYQSHEYPPLGAWESIDRLSNMVSDPNRYDAFKTMVEVCKANGVNFSVMCSANVDMAMKTLHKQGKISQGGTYKEGTYFKLTADEREMVDDMAEEICLSTRFLSSSSDRLYSASKQELKNDLVKGDDKYPRTMSSTINFLQYHSLHNKNNAFQGKYRGNADLKDASFTQDGEEESGTKTRKVSQTCKQWVDDTCAYKKKHTWKECPSNIWGINKGKVVDDKGQLLLCTLAEFEDALVFNDDDLAHDTVYDVEEDATGEDKLNNSVISYTTVNYRSTLHNSESHVDYALVQDDLETRLGTLLSQNRGQIDPNWVLLDSQSTVDVFCNSELLTNIRKIPETLTVHCNAGVMTTNLVGDLSGYGTVWFHQQGIANILSLHNVAEKFHVQYDSRTNNHFVVWREDGSARYFTPGPRGLYYCDVSTINGTILANYDDADEATITDNITNGDEDQTSDGCDPSRVSTVKDKMLGFTQRQIKGAEITRKFQNSAGLTTTGLLAVIDKKMLNNSPITRESARHAECIWGPSVPNLDGKTTRSKAGAVQLNEECISPIPPQILINHPVVILGMDIVKVNGIPFLTTISRVIKLGTATELPDTKAPTIVKALLVIVNMYLARGFRILAIAADYAFEAIRHDEDFAKTNITLNTTSEDEHEPFIERFNRFLKERCRMCYSNLPFLRLPRRMVVELVYL